MTAPAERMHENIPVVHIDHGRNADWIKRHRTRFEYHHAHEDSLVLLLRKAEAMSATEGWELVNVFPTVSERTMRFHAVLKRQVRS